MRMDKPVPLMSIREPGIRIVAGSKSLSKVPSLELSFNPNAKEFNPKCQLERKADHGELTVKSTLEEHVGARDFVPKSSLQKIPVVETIDTRNVLSKKEYTSMHHVERREVSEENIKFVFNDKIPVYSLSGDSFKPVLGETRSDKEHVSENKKSCNVSCNMDTSIEEAEASNLSETFEMVSLSEMSGKQEASYSLSHVDGEINFGKEEASFLAKDEIMSETSSDCDTKQMNANISSSSLFSPIKNFVSQFTLNRLAESSTIEKDGPTKTLDSDKVDGDATRINEPYNDYFDTRMALEQKESDNSDYKTDVPFDDEKNITSIEKQVKSFTKSNENIVSQKPVVAATSEIYSLLSSNLCEISNENKPCESEQTTSPQYCVANQKFVSKDIIQEETKSDTENGNIETRARSTPSSMKGDETKCSDPEEYTSEETASTGRNSTPEQRSDTCTETFLIGITPPFSTMFNLKSKIFKDRKKIIDFMQRNTSCVISLRGKGSEFLEDNGQESKDPLHFHVEYSDPQFQNQINEMVQVLISELHDQFQKESRKYGWSIFKPLLNGCIEGVPEQTTGTIKAPNASAPSSGQNSILNGPAMPPYYQLPMLGVQARRFDAFHHMPYQQGGPLYMMNSSVPMGPHFLGRNLQSHPRPLPFMGYGPQSMPVSSATRSARPQIGPSGFYQMRFYSGYPIMYSSPGNPNVNFQCYNPYPCPLSLLPTYSESRIGFHSDPIVGENPTQLEVLEGPAKLINTTKTVMSQPDLVEMKMNSDFDKDLNSLQCKKTKRPSSRDRIVKSDVDSLSEKSETDMEINSKKQTFTKLRTFAENFNLADELASASNSRSMTKSLTWEIESKEAPSVSEDDDMKKTDTVVPYNSYVDDWAREQMVTQKQSYQYMSNMVTENGVYWNLEPLQSLSVSLPDSSKASDHHDEKSVDGGSEMDFPIVDIPQQNSNKKYFNTKEKIRERLKVKEELNRFYGDISSDDDECDDKTKFATGDVYLKSNLHYLSDLNSFSNQNRDSVKSSEVINNKNKSVLENCCAKLSETKSRPLDNIHTDAECTFANKKASRFSKLNMVKQLVLNHNK